MRKYLVSCLILILVGSPAFAQPKSKLAVEAPKDAIVFDNWEIAYLEGNKAGFIHTVVREATQDGGKVFKTHTELSLTLKRFEDTVNLRMETGCEEDESGKVSAVSMKQLLAKDQHRIISGTVEGKQLRVLVEDIRGAQKTRLLEKRVPWNDEVVGMYHQQRLFKEKQVKPGDKFSYLSYEPTITAVVTNRVTVHEAEQVSLLGGKKQSLLRVVAAPDKVEASNGSVALPALTAWLDKDFVPVRSEVEVPGLGKLTLYRGSRESATGQSGKVAQIQDIGIGQLIRLNARIPKPYDTASAVYRITVKGDEDAASSFARDGRQDVKNAKGSTFELHVRAQRGPKAIDNNSKVKDEYLQSNLYITSDDAKVKAHAAAAVGRETDPWRKAVRIERWVHDNMQNKNFTEAFATADHVARTLEGDCTEHAVLASAMCRAAGIPSRTAFGLIYIDGPRGPSMGFHMWSEVFVRGQWLPIDATLGKGYVGATHLKISDHSWHDIQSLTPLLPVVRVVGKLSIEVVSVNQDD